MALAMTPSNGRRARSTLITPLPPPGVDAGSFYNLAESRRRGYADNLLSIDSAANNTSVVFCLEWRNWRLLFSGDAEQRSWKAMWKMMRGNNPLKPIHLLKVSHHGSHNGMPIAAMLDEIMPEQPPDNRQRYAVISTCLDTYNNVPDDAILTELKKRCQVRSVLDIPEGEFYSMSSLRAEEGGKVREPEPPQKGTQGPGSTMTPETSPNRDKHHRFPREINPYAVWL